MARPWTVTVTGTGESAVYPVDIHREGGIAMGVTISATATFKVQHTFDDVFAAGFTPAGATWFDHPSLGGSANEDSNYAYLPRGIRLNVSASTGSVTLTVMPMGISGA